MRRIKVVQKARREKERSLMANRKAEPVPSTSQPTFISELAVKAAGSPVVRPIFSQHHLLLLACLDAFFLSEPVAFRRVYGLESYSRTSGESNHHRQPVSDTRVPRYQLHHEDDS